MSKINLKEIGVTLVNFFLVVGRISLLHLCPSSLSVYLNISPNLSLSLPSIDFIRNFKLINFQDDQLDVVDASDVRAVSPCNVTFVGDNVVLGKSSLSSKPKAKKVISTAFSFSSQTSNHT